MDHKRHVVLGASGGAGSAIASALVERNHTVRGVSRSGTANVPDAVELVSEDITHPAGLARAIAGADVVYMAAQPPYHMWTEQFPSMLGTVIDGVLAEDATMVMVDNLYMYSPEPQPITEDSPENMDTKKGRLRSQLADMLRTAASARGLRVAIGRASDYYGPGTNLSAITALAIEPGSAGKSMKWLGRLDRRHSVAYLPDIARAFAAIGESERSIGETWILPHCPAPTGAEFLEGINDVLPERVKTGALSKMMLTVAAPFHRVSRETLDIAYQWTDDFVVDDAKFQEAFGPFTVTPLDEGIQATMRAYQGDI